MAQHLFLVMSFLCMVLIQVDAAVAFQSGPRAITVKAKSRNVKHYYCEGRSVQNAGGGVGMLVSRDCKFYNLSLNVKYEWRAVFAENWCSFQGANVHQCSPQPAPDNLASKWVQKEPVSIEGLVVFKNSSEIDAIFTNAKVLHIHSHFEDAFMNYEEMFAALISSGMKASPLQLFWYGLLQIQIGQDLTGIKLAIAAGFFFRIVAGSPSLSQMQAILKPSLLTVSSK